MLDIVLAKSTIRLLCMFQHWQYLYGEISWIQVFADESLNSTPNSRWKGLKLYGFRGGAVPLLLYTFVPARAAGWSPFRSRWYLMMQSRGEDGVGDDGLIVNLSSSASSLEAAG
jgi:hypothetical protein